MKSVLASVLFLVIIDPSLFAIANEKASSEHASQAAANKYDPKRDADGKLLHSQDTGVLESGKSYDLKKLMSFLKRWAPP